MSQNDNYFGGIKDLRPAGDMQAILDAIGDSSITQMEIARDPLVENAENNFASAFRKQLHEKIAAFDASLDLKHEVGMLAVMFGQQTKIHLTRIDSRDPSLIVFIGVTDQGDPVELVQHVTQINVLLVKVPRPNPEEPKLPFGFAAVRSDAKSDDAKKKPAAPQMPVLLVDGRRP